MCSTNEPKIRRGTSPSVKSRSKVIRARDMGLLLRERTGGVLLAAEAGGGDALDDLALEDEEHDDERERRQHRLRHDLGVLDAVGADDGLQAYRQGHQRRVADDDERPEEVVPRAD